MSVLLIHVKMGVPALMKSTITPAHVQLDTLEGTVALVSCERISFFNAELSKTGYIAKTKETLTNSLSKSTHPTKTD